jgi:tetratricopeptide (TPR) repeat protein
MRAALIVVLSILAAVGTSLLMNVEPSESSAAANVLDAGGAPDAEIAALRAEVAELTAQLDAQRARPAAVTGAANRSEVIDIAAAVRAVLAEEGLLGAEGAAQLAARAQNPSDEAVTVEDLLAMLQADGLDDKGWGEVWSKARAAGLSDELIALFEQRAEENPGDADAQAEVGFAYLAKIDEVTDGPAKGMWGMKADEAFDRALEINPDHWDARFTKAISLSFWPPIFGKQAEAIENFEILVERQASLPKSPDHAQTYLLLGNLYQQTGEHEKAAAMWANGAALFPDDAELAARIAQGSGN